MIVICTKCQAKFRVADEKIGARGAKVRCSKCQTVFLVRREGADAPAARSAGSGLDLEPSRSSPPPLPPPLPARAADPFAAFPPAPAPSDPFAPAAPDPFAAPAQPDPFAAPVAASDPFATAARSDPFAAPAAASDPFAAAARPDPFAAPAAGPDPFASPAPPVSAATDLGDLLAAAAAAVLPPLPQAAPAPAAPEPAPDDGLALEERTAAPPRPASSAPFDLGVEAGFDAFAGAGDAQAFDPGSLDLGEPAGDVPALAGLPPEPRPAAPAPSPGSAPRPSLAPSAAEPLPSAQTAADAHERIPGRPSRLRDAAVNAVALAALLVAAAAILALWRTEGPIDASALRPAAVLSALRGGPADVPFATREVRSGLYERERAPPVLFVRGSVVSRAPAPVARVAVRVEVVRDGAVVASAQAIAGGVPTPEEIWGASDAAALAAVATAASRRAPAAVRPGDAVPFLVAIADQPADLAGASLRVHAAPAEGASP